MKRNLSSALLLMSAQILAGPVGAQTASSTPNVVPDIPTPGATVADARLLASEDAPILTVQEAIALALQNNPQRAAARAGLAAAQARISQAKSQGGPQIGLNGGATYDKQFGSAGFPGGGGNAGGGTFDFTNQGVNETLGINAAVPIYTGGRVKASTRAAQALARVQAQQTLQVEQDLVYNAAVGYLAVLRAQELHEVEKSNLAVSAERLRVARVRFDAGAAARLDVLRAESTLADAQVRRITAANSVALAKASLNTVMGRAPETPLRVISLYVAAAPDTPASPNAGSPNTAGTAAPADSSNFALPVQKVSPQALRDLANKNRPILVGAQEQVNAAEANIDVAKAARKPSLSASLSGILRNPVTFLGRFATSLGLGLAQTLFDSGRSKSQIIEAQALAEQSRRSLDTQRQQVAFQLEQQILAVDAAQQRLESTNASITTAREALRAAQIGYQAGARTSVEVSDAQSALLAAQTEAINARFELANARAQLASSIGMLSKDWQVAYEAQLREEIGRIKQ